MCDGEGKVFAYELGLRFSEALDLMTGGADHCVMSVVMHSLYV